MSTIRIYFSDIQEEPIVTGPNNSLTCVTSKHCDYFDIAATNVSEENLRAGIINFLEINRAYYVDNIYFNHDYNNDDTTDNDFNLVISESKVYDPTANEWKYFYHKLQITQIVDIECKTMYYCNDDTTSYCDKNLFNIINSLIDSKKEDSYEFSNVDEVSYRGDMANDPENIANKNL